jgi:hypothetical protein
MFDQVVMGAPVVLTAGLACGSLATHKASGASNPGAKVVGRPSQKLRISSGEERSCVPVIQQGRSPKFSRFDLEGQQFSNYNQ